MLIAILSALFAIFPGCIVTALLRGPRRPFSAQITDSIVFSLLIVSAVAWIPGGSTILFSSWVAFVLAATVCGIAVGIWMVIRGRAGPLQLSLTRWFLAVIVAGTLISFAVILLTRPNLDWDAVTYYLPPALDFALSGHAAPFLSQHITTAHGAPNTQPPIMPMLYGLAVGAAQMFGDTADNAIRLFALVFVAGTWLSVKRLASAFLPPLSSDIAAVLYLLLPATISTVCANPLYLDLGFTFLCTTLIAEIVLFRADDKFAYLRIGAIASAIVLFKVNGLPFVALVACSVALMRIRGRWSPVGAALLALGMIGVSAEFHFFDSVGSPSLFITIAVVVGLLIWTSRHVVQQQSPRAPLAALWGIAALIPAILHLGVMTATVGSPAGYYIPQLTRVSTANWHQAAAVLNQSSIYAASNQPGLPQHFGPGLLLWWGFSPVLALLGLAGIVIAARKSDHVLQVANIALLFALAFLTIFRLDDFRHLLPITPLIPVLACYAIYKYAVDQRRIHWGLLAIASAIPFCWIAQQRFFQTPLGILTPLSWDQWHALSTASFVNILLYCFALILLGAAAFALRPLRQHHNDAETKPFERWAESFAATTILSTTAIITLVFFQSFAVAAVLASCGVLFAMPRMRRAGMVLVASGTILALVFVPLTSTAVAMGFSKQAADVMNGEDGGYLTVLRPAIDNGARLLLTYKSYGITWFSLGHVRRIDLTDATDLGRVEGLLSQRDPGKILRRLHIDGTILPASGGAEWNSYQKLITDGGLQGIYSLQDPLLSAKTGNENWSFRHFFPLTTPERTSAQLVLTSNRRTSVISSGAVTPSAGWTEVTIAGETAKRSWTQAKVFSLLLDAGGQHWAKATVPVRNGSIALARLAHQLNAAAQDIIDLRSVSFSDAHGDVATFSTEGLEIQRENGRAFSLVRGTPMLLHAQNAIAARVFAVDGSGNRLRLYPAPTAGTVGSGRLKLVFQLNMSDLCPGGSPIEVRANAAVQAGNKSTMASYAARAASGGTAQIEFSRSLSGSHLPAFSRIDIQTITLAGTSPACPVTETLIPEALTVLVSPNGSQTLETVPALPMHPTEIAITRP